MKTKLLIPVLIGLSCWLGGCSEAIDAPKTKTAAGYNLVRIDGCQYIEVERGFQYTNNYAYGITHKGNCDNPIHRVR